MSFNKSYAFFLLVTIVGAFFTIKICTAAYAAFSIDPAVGIQVPHHAKLAPQTDLPN